MISIERQTIASALELKHEQLIRLGLSEDEQVRARDLLAMAIRTQEFETIEYQGPWKLEPPYASYYAFNMPKWQVK